MGLRGPGSQRLRQARNQARPPRDGDVTIAPAMIRAFRAGDREFFVQAFSLRPWDYDPIDCTLDDPREVEKHATYTTPTPFARMRALRHQLLRAIGEKVPCPCERGADDGE